MVLLGAALGLVVGLLGTGLGGLAAKFTPRLSRIEEGGMVGFSGGVMLGTVLWNLLPEAWGLGLFAAWGGLLTGMGFIIALRVYYRLEDEQIHTVEREKDLRFTRAGLLLGISIAVHNLPEGVAMGTLFIEDPFSASWQELALLMGVHNIPEGLAVATTLRAGGAGWARIIWVLFLTETPMGIGAMLGGMVGRLSPLMSASALGFAGGAMFLLVWTELIPLTVKVGRKEAGRVGLAVGVLAAWLLIRIID